MGYDYLGAFAAVGKMSVKLLCCTFIWSGLLFRTLQISHKLRTAMSANWYCCMRGLVESLPCMFIVHWYVSRSGHYTVYLGTGSLLLVGAYPVCQKEREETSVYLWALRVLLVISSDCSKDVMWPAHPCICCVSSQPMSCVVEYSSMFWLWPRSHDTSQATLICLTALKKIDLVPHPACGRGFG